MFLSDDGSTAVEVALKRAFRKYLVDRGRTETVDAVQLEVSKHLLWNQDSGRDSARGF